MNHPGDGEREHIETQQDDEQVLATKVNRHPPIEAVSEGAEVHSSTIDDAQVRGQQLVAGKWYWVEWATDRLVRCMMFLRREGDRYRFATMTGAIFTFSVDDLLSLDAEEPPTHTLEKQQRLF
jgi:hypothetical protein